MHQKDLSTGAGGSTFGDPLAPVLQIENNHHAAHGKWLISFRKTSVSVSAGVRKE